MHAASATIKPQDRLHHSAVSFNTGGGVMTLHHPLYENRLDPFNSEKRATLPSVYLKDPVQSLTCLFE